MTSAEIAAYYGNLLIIQYIDKPKAYAMVVANALAVVMDQLPVAVQNAYDINTAVGVQLDVIGKYVGALRVNPVNGLPVTLDDDDYRTLITLVIIKNNSGSSLFTIQNLLAANFPGLILVADNQSMGLNYVLIDTLGTPDLLKILATGAYLPAPMGVQTSVVIVPHHDFPFFGFRTYAGPDMTVSPFNTYAMYSMNAPWLSYNT